MASSDGLVKGLPYYTANGEIMQVFSDSSAFAQVPLRDGVRSKQELAVPSSYGATAALFVGCVVYVCMGVVGLWPLTEAMDR